MALSDAEKAVVVEALGDLEKLIPEIVAAEVAKVSGPYAPLVAAIIPAVMPALIAQLDAAVKAKLA